MTRSVDQAFELFRRASQQADLSVTMESHPHAFGSRLLCASGHGAELRLVWDGKESHLSLEISHGPPSGASAGWLTLYDEVCGNGSLPESSGNGSSFPAALEYGLELMRPGGEPAPTNGDRHSENQKA